MILRRSLLFRPQASASRAVSMRTDVARHRALLAGRRGFKAKYQASEEIAELYIYDAIGADWWGGVSPKDVAAALDSAKTNGAKKLNVYINSPGGDVFDGVAIFNLIKRFDGEKTVFVDGLAASAASVIAMAGERIAIAQNAMIMIHNPWTIAMGDAADMRKCAETLEQIGGVLVDTYVKRTGQKAEDVKSWMDQETWLDAATAKERGFADEIVDDTAEPAEEDADTAAAARARILTRFEKTPKALREQAVAARRQRLSALEARTKDLSNRPGQPGPKNPGQPGR